MQEKIITDRKYGMAVLLGYLALLAAAVLAIIFGAVRGLIYALPWAAVAAVVIALARRWIRKKKKQ